MNKVIEVMKNHRSIRAFSEQMIEQEQVEEIISAAQMASTSNFIQAYSVIQVHDKEKRKKLAHYSGDQAYVQQAPVFLVFSADLYRLEQVIKQLGSQPNFSTIENFILTTVDTALFAQNVMLAAESKGLGGVYIGGIRNKPEEVSKLLELPELVFPLFGMCIGYSKQETEAKKRLPLTVTLHHDSYQKQQLQAIKNYDEEIKEYYLRRSKGKRNETWSQQMAQLFSKPLRAHIKSVLNDKGFRLD